MNLVIQNKYICNNLNVGRGSEGILWPHKKGWVVMYREETQGADVEEDELANALTRAKLLNQEEYVSALLVYF